MRHRTKSKYLVYMLFTMFLLFRGNNVTSRDWPVLKRYDKEHIQRIALPIGGIGTGTISLGGRGNFQDIEIMNRPAKGYNPGNSLFFTLYTNIDGKKDSRLLEGPIPYFTYEAKNGVSVANAGIPRFKEATFETVYPFGQVNLSTPQIPVQVKIKAFNPFIPGEVDDSSIPIAIIDIELTNTSDKKVEFSVCGSMENFIGEDGSNGKAKKNKNLFFDKENFKGILFTSEGVDKKEEQWGEMALVTTSQDPISYRTSWLPVYSPISLLDFWDDFSEDGKLENRDNTYKDKPKASLAASNVLEPHASNTVRYILTWYFPKRKAWSEEMLQNYYTTKYTGALDVVTKTIPAMDELEDKTIEFVNSFCTSDLSEEVKEAALFNASTLRTQTCFRLSDGNFMGWEGCNDYEGSCFGNCTHVWNYENATPFLFGELAKTMRNVEFNKSTIDDGQMSFRAKLPFDDKNKFNKVAADGQMGTIMKLYREWMLSADDTFLEDLYPKAKAATKYAWKEGGWDANKDGVMEGAQHNTMDIEYFGPNPQMTIWYLGALRAMEEMATYMNDTVMAKKCKKLFKSGSKWTDENLFNGEYYIHKIQGIPKGQIPKEQLVNTWMKDYMNPDYQLGEGCLVDQLVGQYLAHICGLGYLVKKENVKKTLQSIMIYNYKADLTEHFNCNRTFAVGDEAGLVMAAYPRTRPKIPFHFFTEVMTGFEYVAATGMLYENLTENGLQCVKSIRERYDGEKRNPFNETECGFHYARAMASWSLVLAESGFHYSAIEKSMSFTSHPGTYFWSNGYAWGTCSVNEKDATLKILHGQIELSKFSLADLGSKEFEDTVLDEVENNSISFDFN
ncbi:GH116 family glycosyl-hydrolase [Maribellus maritimus]|uniref:GH116 family glycosyl-hydrolase n=1 Tax=Maribellus maritimus TaxID=2870838 RepID=UPI001EEB224E|nr:GH116 family glycosyl-hydrolase [Maribellus maritimus]MCG6190108.1 hypothetical protein [Maribellus maritimus]